MCLSFQMEEAVAENERLSWQKSVQLDWSVPREIRHKLL